MVNLETFRNLFCEWIGDDDDDNNSTYDDKTNHSNELMMMMTTVAPESNGLCKRGGCGNGVT